MSIPSDYLARFQKQLDNLQELVSRSTATTSGDFNKKVVEKIGSINKKLAILMEQAQRIVSIVAQLKESINSENREYATNKDEIQNLREKLNELNQENQALQGQVTNITTGHGKISDELNKEIQTKNLKINELTQKMEQLEKELMNQQKIQGEFTAKDEQKIKQIQDLNLKIDQLTQLVSEKETQLVQLNEKMLQDIREKQIEIDQLRSASGNVSGEIEQLKNENKALVEKITYSTDVIMTAINKLEEIRIGNNNPQNLKDIDEKIEEINKFIDKITSILTGASSSDSGAPQPQQSQFLKRSKQAGVIPVRNNTEMLREKAEKYDSGDQNVLLKNIKRNIGGKKHKMRGGFIANYDMKKNRKSRKSSTSTSSYSSKSRIGKRTKKNKHSSKRSSGFYF